MKKKTPKLRSTSNGTTPHNRNVKETSFTNGAALKENSTEVKFSSSNEKLETKKKKKESTKAQRRARLAPRNRK